MKKDTRDIALNTYRSLRIGMVVMIVMLGIAVIFERITANCWETSISAYYFTAAHSIFVAALCAIGALLIVYEGSSDTEDAFLNLAGVLAFVVAMVPTTRAISPCGVVLPESDVAVMIKNNVWSVVVAFAAVQVGIWTLEKKRRSDSDRSFLGVVGLVVFWVVIAVGLIGFIWFRNRFDSLAHYSAAVILFAAIIVTVGITAFLVKRQESSKSPHRLRYHVIYVGIAIGMIVTLVAVVVVHFALSAWNHWIIFIEVVLILEFAGYWAVQTIELWDTLNRKELLSEQDQTLLAQGRTERGLEAVAADEPVATTKRPRGERVLSAL